MTAPRRDAVPPAVLGTPLTNAATKVLLLGSGELGKEVAIAFQRLGVEVIAVDRYADAPAQQVAHHSAVIDMTDPAAVIEVIEKFQPDFVVPEIEAIATDALVEVERRGLAEVIPTAHAVVTTMNREGIRRLADEELGLPVSPYLFVDSLDELVEAAGEIGFPCVVKPVMSSSGKGQSIVRSADEVAAAWETATTGARVATTRLIVEGYIEFDYEVTLLTVRAVDPRTGRLETHFCAPIGHFQVSGDYVESWQPHEMNSFALGAATSIAARIATALGDGKLGGRGIFGVELFVKGDDVYFSEVSPRPHDTGLVTLATQRLSEFEMHARAILGLPVDVTLASPGASAVIYGQLDEQGIGFTNVAQALAIPETDIRLFGKPQSFHRRRMGVVTATADDVATARKRAVAAASLVNPVSTADGKDAAAAAAATTALEAADPAAPASAKQSLVKPPTDAQAEPAQQRPTPQPAGPPAPPRPPQSGAPVGAPPVGGPPAGAPPRPPQAGPGGPRPVGPQPGGQSNSVQPSQPRPPQGPPPNSPPPNGRTPMVQPHRPGPPVGPAGRAPNGAAQAGPGPSGPRRPVPPNPGPR